MQTYNQSLGTGITVDTGTAGSFSNQIDVSQFDRFTIQANFTYAVGDDAAGNCYLLTSLDGTNWSTVPDSGIAYSSTTGNNIWSVTVNVYKWIKVNFIQTSVSNTGATAAVLFQGFINDKL